MNNDTLTAALDRMATALEPPIRADELIATRRTQLRRRRRVTTGLAAASVLAIIATGGVLASGLGSASPDPDGVPVASDGPSPAAAVDDAVDPTTDTQVEPNESPWHCDGEALTPAEIEEFENTVLGETQLSMEVTRSEFRAYVVTAEGGNAAYEIKARHTGGEAEILSVTRCAS